MVSSAPKDTKLLVLPEKLVDSLREITVKKGVSLTSFAEEALRQAIRMEAMGARLEDAVDIYGIHEVSRASGSMEVPRSNFNAMITQLYRAQREELMDVWRDAGRWNGEYLRARLGEDALGFFRSALLVSWNLDEVNVAKDGLVVKIEFVSFSYSVELTELLISYILGFMDSLGYNLMEKDSLRGLATLFFREENNR